ncbi:comF family domain protein, partial [Vibrio cholerae CP1050(23)]
MHSKMVTQGFFGF